MNEKLDKRMVSQARVSKWPNTIHAERERKEYERIKKLEDDEVSIVTIFNHILFNFEKILIGYIFWNRLKEEELMLKRKLINTIWDKTSSIKLTRCSMIIKIWSRLFTVRCSSVMSLQSKRSKHKPKRERKILRKKLTSNGKSLRNKRCKNMMRDSDKN